MKISSSVRKTLAAISFLWLGQLAGAGLVFITHVVLARELTPSGYGVFDAALATTTALVPLAGLGEGGFWLNAFGAEGWGGVHWVSRSVPVGILAPTVTLLLRAALTSFGPHDGSFR